MMILPAFFLSITALLAAADPAKPLGKALGKPFTLRKAVSVETVLEKPDRFVGKTVQVKGQVTEVCMMMGCWMSLKDPDTNRMIRVKVNDGEIVFPKESVGKQAIAEGKLAKLELSREQAVARAKHEAEEQGRAFDPTKVTGPLVVYQIQGTGARLLE
jgi:hypothetical protein